MPSDREVLWLAVPALGALIAEPLYVLGDTAIVGHLGTLPLAGLALGGLLLSEIFGFCTFLEYGTTSRAARLYGADRHDEAIDVGVQATWLAIGLGIALIAVIELLAGPAIRLLGGGDTAAAGQALEWIRIAALGAPLVLIVAAGQGWMRAFQDTVTPLIVIGVANVLSIGVSAILIIGLGMGIEGSAIANVLAQAASGLVFLEILRRKGAPLRPSWARIRLQLGAARDLSVRTLAFFAAFTIATGVAARMGNDELAAQQIGVQLWGFCALFLDATAIAAQALIGRLLGGSAVSIAEALARRLMVAGLLLGFVFGAVFGLGHNLIPKIFTDDPGVLHQAAVLWPWLAGMMPMAGVLFALDGVFFGAGDLRFMRNVSVIAAVCAFMPLTLAAAHWDWGLTGIWAGLTAFVATRLVIGLFRWRGKRWIVAGVAPAGELP